MLVGEQIAKHFALWNDSFLRARQLQILSAPCRSFTISSAAGDITKSRLVIGRIRNSRPFPVLMRSQEMSSTSPFCVALMRTLDFLHPSNFLLHFRSAP